MFQRPVPPTPPHWNYYLSLEDDLLSLSRAIEFCPTNLNCFSIDLAKILMSAASEVEVVAKLLCGEIDRDAKPGNILEYQDLLLRKYVKLPSAQVMAPRFDLTFKPWASWENAASAPPWWRSYNKVKHLRSEHFDHASLDNALTAVAGLFVLTLAYFGTKVDYLQPPPRLFRPSQEFGSANAEHIVYVGGLEVES